MPQAVLVSVLVCLAVSAHAGTPSVKVSVEMLEAYDDNIFFIDEDKPTAEEIEEREEAAEEGPDSAEASSDKEADTTDEEEPIREMELEDFVTTLSPHLDLGYTADEWSVMLTARLNFIRYDKYSELDDVEYLYKSELSYELSEYTNLSLDASYKKDVDQERELEDSGLIFGTTVRNKQECNISIDHELTGYASVSLTYGYEQEDFDTSSLDEKVADLEQAELDALAEEAEEYLAEDQEESEEEEGEEEEERTPEEELLEKRLAEDSRAHIASLTLRRDTGTLLTDSFVYTTASYTHYATSESVQDNVTMVLGVGYSYDESWSFRADAGARKSHEDYKYEQLKLLAAYPYYDQVDVAKSQDESGPVAHVSIEYKGEWSAAGLELSYDIKPASGIGTLTKQTEVSLDYTQYVSESLSLTGFTRYIAKNRDGVYLFEPLADEEALKVHNEIPALKERLEEEEEPLYGVSSESWHVGAEISWDINQYFTLTAKYTYSAKKEKLICSDARRNRFFLQLDVNYSLW